MDSGTAISFLSACAPTGAVTSCHCSAFAPHKPCCLVSRFPLKPTTLLPPPVRLQATDAAQKDGDCVGHDMEQATGHVCNAHRIRGWGRREAFFMLLTFCISEGMLWRLVRIRYMHGVVHRTWKNEIVGAMI